VSLDEHPLPIHEHRRLREQMLAQAAPRRDDPETWRLMRATEQEARDRAADEAAHDELMMSPETAGAQWARRFQAAAAEREAVYYDDRGMG
jgi:hypothetical protein